MRTHRVAALPTSVALSWALCSVAAGMPSHRFQVAAATVTDLGSLGGPQSSALGINDAGQVVGWAATTQGVQHAFLLSNGSMTDIGAAAFGPAHISQANGINATGDIAGTMTTQVLPTTAFQWKAGVVQFLVAFKRSPPFDETYGLAINAGGDVCGYMVDSTTGFVAGMVWLNGRSRPPRAQPGYRYDINSSGVVVGDMIRWTPQFAGTFAYDVVPPPASGGYSGGDAVGLNDRGNVVGYATLATGPGSPADRAYLWDGVSASSVELGVLPNGINSYAEDINESMFIAGHADERLASPPLQLTHEVAFLYHRDFGIYPLPALQATTRFRSCRAVALNERQPSSSLVQLVGQCDTPTGSRAVRWDVTVQSVSILPPGPIP
jgi:probable HAF family extracellular repeat protein